MNEEYYIGQIFEEMYPSDAATWCIENGADIREISPVEDVRRFEIVEREQPPAPTHESMRKKRELAYAEEVDGITAHIQRLRDLNPVPKTEIEELMAERNTKVTAIKKRYPYPDEQPPME